VHHGRVTTSPDPAAPSDSAEPGGRVASGTVFVTICAVLAVGFVLFLVFGSPVLLDRTLALAPPPAPQVVASGELDGRTWSATAYDGTADQRGVDDRGVEAVVEPEPCLAIDLGGGGTADETCVLRRGGSIRTLDAVVDDSGRALVSGIVAPEVVTVALELGDGGVLEATPTYVDFGFPLGFFVVEVDAATAITGAEAVGRQGEVRSTAVCEGAAPFASCEATEGDY
jgi:hypothetical protein